MLTAVVDTNVLVSAALSPGSVPHRIVAEWKEGAFELVVSPLLLAELERVLCSPRLDLPRHDVEEALAELREGAVLADDPPIAERAVPNDRGDDFLVALARAAGASVIVTGDRHLLELAGLQPPAGTPRVFLAAIAGHGL